MRYLYNLIIFIISIILPLIALFNHKIKLFVQGRKTIFSQLENKILPTDQVIWFHVASLGEYEQGLPIMQAMKEKYPLHKMVLTFFSPSGFEVRKNNTVANVTVYLPIDTIKNATKFLKIVHPQMVFFVKYEFWPNYLYELKSKKIDTYLVSGIFRDSQLFFKPYGGFYRQALTAFNHFFVQNKKSADLLNQIGFSNQTISGDTRFDRVYDILKLDKHLDFVEKFKVNQRLVVAGSTWAKDETLLVNYINYCKADVKFIIAPHNIKADDILQLKAKISKPTVLYSEMTDKDLSSSKVMILDTIGLLTKVYSYAHIAYVGGGFGNPGVHNVLEPAVFGLPVMIGPNYNHFAEASALVEQGGCLVISNEKQLKMTFDKLLSDPKWIQSVGQICKSYILKNKGATDRIKMYFDKK